MKLLLTGANSEDPMARSPVGQGNPVACDQRAREDSTSDSPWPAVPWRRCCTTIRPRRPVNQLREMPQRPPSSWLSHNLPRAVLFWDLRLAAFDEKRHSPYSAGTSSYFKQGIAHGNRAE